MHILHLVKKSQAHFSEDIDNIIQNYGKISLECGMSVDVCSLLLLKYEPLIQTESDHHATVNIYH